MARAQNSRLGPGAVLVLVVLSIAVVWKVLIDHTGRQVRSLVM